MSQPGRDRVWVLPVPQGRTYGQGNYLMRFDIDQAGGEHGNQLQRYNEYIGAGEQTYVDWHNLLQHPSFLNAANVRYIIAGVPLQGVPWSMVHQGSGVIYENPDALPRAYLVDRVVAASPPDGALSIMQGPNFDPHTSAVVYGDVTMPGGPGSPGTARLEAYEPDRVVLDVQADRPALLVLADNMYEGWQATVDGEPAEIHYANHTFRGVRVGAGSHEVVFRFRNADLRRGFWVYATGWIVLLAYGGFLAVIAVRGRAGRKQPR
jgi:hypothetical protein